ncbi:MAG: tyrosine-type recombinase/integrase [Clostridiales bacterium]|nr:tyrosine-type recombinase/integrase [Clostridiales bacterium]
MAARKEIRIHNKSDKPDNVVKKENETVMQCQAIEKELPGFMRGFFAYLRGNVLPMSRLAYLHDIRFFCNYLIRETGISASEDTKGISQSEFNKVKASDVNFFIDYCRRYETETEKAVYIYENQNRSLARKKSSVSVLFKYLYRDGLVDNNITDGFDPIRVPKSGEREIKALQDDEVMVMLDAVSTGDGLTKKEREFWEKTKKRDKAILVLFLTYGLRLSELQQLNVSSINFSRGEFKIYRKRGKESTMPLNKSVVKVVTEYLEGERAQGDRVDPLHKDALFLSLQGSRMTERQIRELVKKYTSLGLKTSRDAGYSPHKLRATAATSLIGRGNSIFDVQALLDHEQVTTTQLYAAHKMNVKRDLVNDMEWELERTENNGKDSGKEE